MGIQITTTVSDAIYYEMMNQAQKNKQDVSDIARKILTEALTLLPMNEDDEEMLREEAAYKQMHPKLVRQYFGQNVAIYKGKLIDFDEDLVNLLRRVRRKYPSQIVLLREVKEEPDPILHFRSPRFVTS